MAAKKIGSRAYQGSHDLRAMQQLVVDNVATSTWRLGDLAWAARDNTHRALAQFIRLFTAGEELIGWTWVRSRGLIDVELLAGRRVASLYEEMIQAGEDIVAAMRGAGDDVSQLRSWVPDDDRVMGRAFANRGYAATDLALQVNRRAGLDELPLPRALPAGWAFAAVDSDGRTASRVECHRAAFAPSALTVESYSRARACWPYRADLDRVIVDEAGEVVAACTAWLDEANAEGLLEPVATRPDQQRRAYGRAVCIDALRALREAGARSARVLCVAGAPACATYAAIGFEPAGLVTCHVATRTDSWLRSS